MESKSLLGTAQLQMQTSMNIAETYFVAHAQLTPGDRLSGCQFLERDCRSNAQC